jgi:hypothetical protein
MVVNGKYVVTGRSSGSHENMVKVVDFLINKESASTGSTGKK